MGKVLLRPSEIMYFIACVIFNVYVVACVVILIRFRRLPIITPRSPRMMALQILTGTSMVTIQLLRLAFPTHIPCYLVLWISTFAIPLTLLLFSFRLLRLAFLYRRGQGFMAFHALPTPPQPIQIPMGDSTDASQIQDAQEGAISTSLSLSLPRLSMTPATPEDSPPPALSAASSLYGIYLESNESDMASVASSDQDGHRIATPPGTPNGVEDPYITLLASPPAMPSPPEEKREDGEVEGKGSGTGTDKAPEKKLSRTDRVLIFLHIYDWVERTLDSMSRSFSDRAAVSLLFVFMFSQFSTLTFVQRNTTQYAVGEYHCSSGWEIMPLYVLTLLAFIGLIPAAIAVRGIHDAYGIRVELYSTLLVAIFGYIASGTIDILSLFEPLDAVVAILPGHLFFVAAIMCLLHIQVGIPVFEILRRPSSRGHVDWIGFQELLSHPKHRGELRDFAILEMSVENVLFYEQVVDLKWKFSERSKRARHLDDLRLVHALLMRDLRTIYHYFIAPGSEMEVNIPGPLRERLCLAFNTHPYPGVPGFLDDAQVSIMRLMYENTYPRLIAYQEAKARGEVETFQIPPFA